MSTCEFCWDDAFLRARLAGTHQVDEYRKLLKETEWDTAIRLGAEALRSAPQMAPKGLDPDAGMVVPEDRTPISVAAWQQLHHDPGFPVVHDEDQEMTCEYTGRRVDECNCDAHDRCPCGADCGVVHDDEPYDESYWDAKKDDLI